MTLAFPSIPNMDVIKTLVFRPLYEYVVVVCQCPISCSISSSVENACVQLVPLISRFLTYCLLTGVCTVRWRNLQDSDLELDVDDD